MIHPDDCLRILQLRLAIARAAQSDSMNWWADESLTPDATFLLGRLFPRSIERSRQCLALQAARARHQAKLTAIPRVRHLFDLGDAAEFQIKQVFQRGPRPQYPSTPISSAEELKTTLIHIVGNRPTDPIQPSQADRLLEIEIEAGWSLMRMAEVLAWSYVQGERQGPLFPFVRDDQ